MQLYNYPLHYFTITEIHMHYTYDFTITYKRSHENYIAKYRCLKLNFDLNYDYLILLLSF